MASNTQALPFVVGPMTLDDIPAVMAIEKTAFPLPWPEQAYRHELLENKNGYFIVIRLTLPPNGTGPQPGDANAPANAPANPPANAPITLLQRLTSRPAKPVRPVIGYAGLWMMVDEGHISTIAAHPDWRGHGVGELLLVSLLREAQRRKALFATLEVRVSNSVAQNLYTKYGFVEVGRRKRYYRDNNEDALIMTVRNFREPEYDAKLDALERALFTRLSAEGRKTI